MHDRANTLVLAHLWVAFTAFVVAAMLGFFQVASTSGLFPALHYPEMYFTSVSTHGTLMAYVLTTFFVMGFGYFCATTGLQRPVWSPGLAWAGFGLALAGVLIAAVPLLLGQASVMYTFYPPQQANPAYYLGATLLVVGSWFWCVIMIVMMMQWKRDNPGKPVPLVMFGTTANAVLWLWTSAGVGAEMLFQLIPWSLGWLPAVDVGLARTLFAWTLHAIVYFWLIPAYIVLYTMVPQAAGGRLFSDEVGRIAFVMLLIFSLPIGFHHLFMDPEQAAGFKLFHTFGTFGVAIPTFMTGFTIIASLEIAGRLRGGKGLFGWIAALDWGDPLVLATIFAMLFLVLGGFGGVVNASYGLNTLIHNTAWVTAHFHLILAGTTIILYMAGTYAIWPKLTGRRLATRQLAVVQLWLWFVGMVVTTSPWHVLGLLGFPRRVSRVVYSLPLTAEWAPYQVAMAIGGALLALSAVLFFFILVRTRLNPAAETDRDMVYAEAVHPVLSVPRALNGFALWNWVLLIWMIAAFAYPIAQFFILPTYEAVARDV